MKKHISIVFILISSYLSGQVNITNTSLDTTIDILYFGTNQCLKITGLSNSKDFVVTSCSGRIRQYKDFNGNIIPFEYDLEPEKKVKNDTICILQNKKVVCKKVFKMRYLKDFRASIGNIKDTLVKVQDILNKPIIKVYIPNSHLKSYQNERIISFGIKIKDKSKSLIADYKDTNSDYKNTEGFRRLTDQQINCIKNLKKGDFIILYNVKIVGSVCPMGIGNTTITIKE